MGGVTVVRKAGPDDVAGIVEVMHDAFGRVARMHGIEPDALPPLREGEEDLVALMREGVEFWVAVTPGARIAGTVRAAMVDGAVEIGRLAVSSGSERQGIATMLMDALESAYPQATAFRLFTGKEAAVPLSLYRGRGYRETHEEEMGGVTLVWLEKPGPGR